MSLIVVYACGPQKAASQLNNDQRTKDVRSPLRHEGTVEGYVFDSQTSAALPGATVDVGRPGREGVGELGMIVDVGRPGGDVEMTMTDERGHYAVELPPGTLEISASVGTATTDVMKVDVHRGRVTRFDMRIDHAKLLASLQDDPPINCPASPPGAVIEGHTTTQSDIDAIATTVLERFISNRGSISDGGLIRGDVIYVRVDLEAHHHLTKEALPTGTRLRFVPKTQSELQDESDRSGKNVRFIDFRSIYSDGRCAVVQVGMDFAMPTNRPDMKTCCCTGTDVYEQREGKWVFVRRAYGVCL
jgi:hypothetical protein